jgi:hypothetical protein
MTLIRRMRALDVLRYSRETYNPAAASLLAAIPFGHEVWEYSDMRGPLDGDGGLAIVTKDGRVIHRLAVWFS